MNVPDPDPRAGAPSSPPGARRRHRGGVAAALALAATLVAGCATTSPELGRIERLPEGTLPPGKEVGPPVNIQPPPRPLPARPPGYRPPYPYPYPYPGYPYRPLRGAGLWGPAGPWAGGAWPCIDPILCGAGGLWVGPHGPGFSLGIRLR